MLTQVQEPKQDIGPAEIGRYYMVKVTDYKAHKKPISKEDQEVFDWIGQKLQDIYDGKDPYISDEEAEKDRQEWLKTQPPVEQAQER